MANIYIGNPLDILKEYVNRKEYRSLITMTNDECRFVLEFAIDNGDFKGNAVNHLKISAKHSNFVEGDVSFGSGETYYFTIRYDGTITIHKMEFSESNMKFFIGKDTLKIYRFSDIIYVMMKQGFDLISHLK